MINGDEKYYYFAVKSKLELYSSECFRSKKESITNEIIHFDQDTFLNRKFEIT